MKLDNEFFYLPERFWNRHKQCELLIRQIEEFIIDDKYDSLRNQRLKLDPEDDLKDNEHIFDYLLRKNRKDEHDYLIKTSLINGLLIDVCYFLQEALACSKKKRLTVTFSLLRKPFIYDLPVLLRILFDNEFLDDFNNQHPFDVNQIKEERKKELIKKSLDLLIATKSLNDIEIYDWIFNQDRPDSLINITNKALHLSTSRNKNMNNNTEIQNLNFIFSNQNDIEILWNFLYNSMPLYLLYLIEVIDALIFSTIELPKELYGTRLEKRIEILSKYGD